jgi:alkanesulfonate monooxygenase SsuD/methylene tetrahydromethanopterin reductase-like flavin-dependent oxidoreductase (luciferase family)
VSYVVHADRFRQSLDRIARHAAEAGRSLDGFARAHLTFITIGRDYESAERVWVDRLSRRYAQDFAPFARKYGIIGTPSQCLEQLQAFAAAGCTDFLMNPIGVPADEGAQLEAIARDIAPRLRAS